MGQRCNNYSKIQTSISYIIVLICCLNKWLNLNNWFIFFIYDRRLVEKNQSNRVKCQFTIHQKFRGNILFGFKSATLTTLSVLFQNAFFVLLMLWQISEIHVTGESEDMTAKERLLLWSKQITDGYVGVRCENFTTSWRDGRLFNAIIHKYRYCLNRTSLLTFSI